MQRIMKHDKYVVISSVDIDSKKSNIKQPKFYTPFATKSPFLLTIFCALLACIALLEIALENGTTIESNSDGVVHQAAKYKRQAASPTSSNDATSSYTSIVAISGTMTVASTATATVPGPEYSTPTTEPTSAGSDTSIASAESAAASLFNTIETTYYDTSSDVYNTIEAVSTFTTTPNAYKTIETTAGSTTAPGIYNTIQTSSPTTPKASTRVTTVPAATSLGAYNVVGTSSNTASSTASHDGGAKSMNDILTSTETAPYSHVALTAVTDSFSPASTFLTTITTATAVEATLTLTTSNGELQVTVVTSSITSALTLVVASTAATASASASAIPEFHTIKSELQLGTTFTPASYFCAMYLAIFVAVLFKLTWTIVFSSTKMMEPFFQLSRPEGASAKETLLADYLSSSLSLSSVRNVLDGHWVMLLTSSAYITTGLLPSLASGAMTVKATAYCGKNNTSPCNLVWILKVPVVRGVQALLSLAAIMVIALVILRRPRRSGVFSNPSSIASMAALFSHRGVLHDIRRIDPNATEDQIAEALSGNHYMMGSFESSPRRHRYGLMKKTGALTAYRSQTGTDVAASHNISSHFWKEVLRDILFLLCILGLFGVVLAYYLDSANDAFNRFFNSGEFAPRFILTLSATVIDNHWKRIEREVRVMTPYRRLRKRNAMAGKTILVSMNGTPISSFPLAVSRGDVFHAMVAFTAIMSDILIVAIAGVPFAQAQVWLSFIVSAYVSLGILGLMVLVVLETFWWRAGNERMGMPRAPSTMVAVLMMLCNEGNGLRREFEGWEGVGTAARDIACKKRKGRYWTGRILEGDGRERWVVDCEEKFRDEGGGSVAVNY